MSDIVRNIDTVTAEIIVIRDNAKKVFYDAVIKIGCRLLEAKDLVPHGEWTHYLQSVLGYRGWFGSTINPLSKAPAAVLRMLALLLVV
ncbi:DUF3102 domain-containing protein, partial [Butyricicoccus pullicaecorum]|uniref:DUF3102 domain-containing protein n=1 Tax=Butyricicoccus pullicaecorum TaxID=501571 RepID=UPI0039908F63